MGLEEAWCSDKALQFSVPNARDRTSKRPDAAEVRDLIKRFKPDHRKPAFGLKAVQGKGGEIIHA